MAVENDRRVRVKKIQSLLHERREVSVREMAQRLQVSEMTVRRDLSRMETERLLRRTHGGAVLTEPGALADSYELGEQTLKNARQKNTIGLRAAQLVGPEETIILDSGSTTPYVARHIDRDAPLTVICYTFKNALEFYPRQNTNLILLGGYFHRASNIFHSEECRSLLQNMRADKAFISAAGVDAKLGLTTFFYFEADVKKALIQAAQRVILVTDSSKFGKVSTTYFGELSEVDTVITDDGLSDEQRQVLEGLGIELIIAGPGAGEHE
ncbi:MAG: DeoR/GlpR transcriptional regulator [Spirochaetales bacterium]|nr:DeoR/GlpR transcriptional regulator [Spirochaetales bacterium]